MNHKDRMIRSRKRGQTETAPEKGAPALEIAITLSEDQIKLLNLFSAVDNISREDWIARVVGRCLVDRASGYR